MKAPGITRASRLHWAAAGGVPGAVGGALFAACLLFLNPQIPLSGSVVVRSVGFFGSIGAVIGLVLLFPLSRARLLQPWRLLPWTLTAVLGGSALSLWVHASRFSFYLSPGLDNRLIRAALWATLLALVTFYTALLHSLQDRRYSGRSRLLIGACAFLSVALTFERRSAYRPQPTSTPGAIFTQLSEPPRLIVVGIDSATLDAILPLAEQGRLPFLADLLQRGAYGRLAGFLPVDPLPMWTSLATGEYPYRHGVVSDDARTAPFATPDAELHLLPVGFGMPAWASLLGMSSLGRPPLARSPALWEVLESSRASTALVGWPRPRGGESRSDIAISQELFRGRAEGRRDQGSWNARALERQLRPDTIDPAILVPFGEHPPFDVRTALAQDLWRESVALEILSNENVDTLLIHLPGLGEISRRYFGAYVATQFEGRQNERLDDAAQIVAAYYSQLDSILRRLWEAVAGPKLLAVVSPWGADEAPVWRQLAVNLSGRGPAMAGRTNHAPDGVLMLLGENLSSGTFLDDATIVDVAPTLLYGLGLPIARDLDGRVLTRSFSATFLNRTPLTFVPSFPRPRQARANER